MVVEEELEIVVQPQHLALVAQEYQVVVVEAETQQLLETMPLAEQVVKV
jgi:hypothetical protein